MGEKLYLVCDDCGEAFEADPAGVQAAHELPCDQSEDMLHFTLQTEDEAF